MSFSKQLSAFTLLSVCAIAMQLEAAVPQTELDQPALPDDAPWGRVLDHFQLDGGLDYASLKASPEDLELYLASLSAARPSEASREERIAFWSNVYNAVTAKFVIERYPEIESVRDVEGFFKSLRFRVAGEELTLDEIEQRALREGEPRVHFAVVCASASCPDLRWEPYRGADLDRQLEEQTAIFLSDPSKGLRYEGDELWLSSIFMWYAGDFTGGNTMLAYLARGKVRDWVVEHLPAELGKAIHRKEPSVRYLDYDWALNDRRRDAP